MNQDQATQDRATEDRATVTQLLKELKPLLDQPWDETFFNSLQKKRPWMMLDAEDVGQGWREFNKVQQIIKDRITAALVYLNAWLAGEEAGASIVGEEGRKVAASPVLRAPELLDGLENYVEQNTRAEDVIRHTCYALAHALDIPAASTMPPRLVGSDYAAQRATRCRNELKDALAVQRRKPQAV
jgi:hypothetical protein